jgi:nitrogen fixation protein NifB
VASLEGALINQHLGEATRLLIFEKNNAGIQLVDTRETPEPGTGKQRWLRLAETLKDCSHLLVSGIGASPQEILEHEGIEILVTEGLLYDALNLVFAGFRPPSVCSWKSGCTAGCSGGGMGCG